MSGTISADATWRGVNHVTGDLTIKAGVTVTVEAGATLSFKPGIGLNIAGTLNVAGTSAAKVNLQPETGNYFGNLNVSGTLDMKYAVMKGGSISTSTGSITTITDSMMSGASGDLLMPSGGSVTMTYSQIGTNAGVTDTTHCDIHISGGTMSITKSNINAVPYGLMLYGGTNIILTGNNWMDNGIAIDASVAGDVSGSYFKGGVPASGLLIKNNLSSTMLTDAGPRQ